MPEQCAASIGTGITQKNCRASLQKRGSGNV
jgi:hypothetical protein